MCDLQNPGLEFIIIINSGKDWCTLSGWWMQTWSYICRMLQKCSEKETGTRLKGTPHPIIISMSLLCNLYDRSSVSQMQSAAYGHCVIKHTEKKPKTHCPYCVTQNIEHHSSLPTSTMKTCCEAACCVLPTTPWIVVRFSNRLEFNWMGLVWKHVVKWETGWIFNLERAAPLTSQPMGLLAGAFPQPSSLQICDIKSDVISQA